MAKSGLSVAKKLLAKCKCKDKSFSLVLIDDELVGSPRPMNHKKITPVLHFEWHCCGLKVIVNGELGSVLS